MTSEALFEQLKHPNPNMRNRAMLEIADTRDENTIPRLREFISWFYLGISGNTKITRLGEVS